VRIVVVDTYYDDFLKTCPIGNGNYQEELNKVLAMQFATADFYSRNLRAQGHDVIDIIANHEKLQERWAAEHGCGTLLRPAWEQILLHNPDVIFFQDLSIFPIDRLHALKNSYLLVAQHSCPWAGDDSVSCFDIIMTSFPHYVPRIEALGVKAVYVPLAFEPSVVDYCFPDVFPVVPTETIQMDFGRIHDCVFIGGVGNPSHWKRGMETLETVARDIPTFKWWGYGVETLPTGNILKQKYQGQAWGREMYEILLRSKIVLNRHGEVAQNFANNMRLYEATGCGALLLTEDASNIWDLFRGGEIATYLTPGDAVQKIKHYLAHEDERADIASRGQRRTFADHTYAKRMKQVSDVLIGALQAA